MVTIFFKFMKKIMKLIKTGATRWVLITKKYAFKFPSLYSYKNFLLGLLANMQEIEFWSLKWEKLCPIIFYLPFGLLVVMPKCKMLTIEEWNNFNLNNFRISKNGIIPVENKRNSFGKFKNKIVAIDYGG